MNVANNRIVFDDVSKFYGEVLGVNRVNLSLPPGVTSLVGPNGSGKTTLMNLMTGLVRPTQGSISVLGLTSGPAGGILSPCRLLHAIRFISQRRDWLRIYQSISPVARADRNRCAPLDHGGDQPGKHG